MGKGKMLGGAGVALVKPQAPFCFLGVAAQCGVPLPPQSSRSGCLDHHPARMLREAFLLQESGHARGPHGGRQHVIDSGTCPRAETEAAGTGWEWGGWMEGVPLAWKGASCQLALGQGGKNPWNMAVFQLPSRWGFSSKRQGPHQELGMEGLAGQAWFPGSSGRARVGEGDTLGT